MAIVRFAPGSPANQPGECAALVHGFMANPTMLAVLGRHEGAVNCVRWSHKGKYLASASDDRSILLWELKAEPATAAFGEAPGTEVRACLRGRGWLIGRWSDGADPAARGWSLTAPHHITPHIQTNGKQNAENWTVALTCAGHELDVVHVDWAADDSLLASARSVVVFVFVACIGDGAAHRSVVA